MFVDAGGPRVAGFQAGLKSILVMDISDPQSSLFDTDSA
jgi:hypothetical protein